jgi:glycosyltransferase involved in cell wall biosynthesis
MRHEQADSAKSRQASLTRSAPPQSHAGRVCHVISSFHPVVGGAERATQTLLRALLQRDDEVIVLTRRFTRDAARFERIDGVPVYRLGRVGGGKLAALTFGLHALMLLGWRLRGWHIVHVQNIDTPLLVGLLAKVLLRRKLVATIHGHTQILGRNRSLRGRLRTWMMARWVDRFTSINPENTSVLLGIGVPRAHVHEIANGVDMEVFRPPSPGERAAARASLGLADEEFVVVYIGRLVPWKRVDLLITAWSRLDPERRGRLIIVGDGPEAQALRTLADRSEGVVQLEGITSEPTTYLWAADVFANASGDNRLQGEGLSVALLEAMAVGVPPVVTQGPGNDVLVDDDVTGLKFPVQDVEALRGCLTRMHGDASLRQRLGQAAHERVRLRYSSEAIAEQLETVYRSLDVGSRH